MGEPNRLLQGNLKEAYSYIRQLELFKMPNAHTDSSYSLNEVHCFLRFPARHYNSAQIMAVHLNQGGAIQGSGYARTLQAPAGAGKQHLGSAKSSVRSSLNDPKHQATNTQQ